MFGTTGGDDALIAATITTVLLTWVLFIFVTAIISFALAIALPAWAIFIYRSDVEKHPDGKITRIDSLTPEQMFHGPDIDDAFQAHVLVTLSVGDGSRVDPFVHGSTFGAGRSTTRSASSA